MVQVGSVSSTGHGESITRTCLAITAVQHMQSGSYTLWHTHTNRHSWAVSRLFR